MEKGLIMLNMSHRFDWQAGLVNRNYHVLQTILRRHAFDKVLSIDFIPFTWKKKIKVIMYGKIWQHCQRPVYRSPRTLVERDSVNSNLYHMTAFNLNDLKHILTNLQFPQDQLIIWSYNPLAAEVFTDFPQAVKVFDAVDNWIEHPSYAGLKERLAERYKTIQKSADVIFTVSEGLIDFFQRQENVYYIPNGVDAAHFSQATCERKLLRKNFLPHKPVIGYHGIIQTRLNFSILDYLTTKHLDYQFVIAGPVWKEVRPEIKMLRKKTNVYVLPQLAYKKLPNLLACFNVAIVPHKVDTFTQTMNPLKIYEYLAAGLPIVSTAISGADQFQDLVQLAVSPEDFSIQIQKELAGNNADLKNRRMAMAHEHSWDVRVELMLHTINKYITARQAARKIGE